MKKLKWPKYLLQYIFDRNKSTIRYILLTTILAFTSTILILSVLDFLWVISEPVPTPSEGGRELWLLMARYVLVTPFVENIFLIIFLVIISELIKDKLAIVITIALASGMVHGLVHQWAFVAGGVLFAIMSFSYINYSENPFLIKFSIIFAQHALFNTPATVSRWLAVL